MWQKHARMLDCHHKASSFSSLSMYLRAKTYVTGDWNWIEDAMQGADLLKCEIATLKKVGGMHSWRGECFSRDICGSY